MDVLYIIQRLQASCTDEPPRRVLRQIAIKRAFPGEHENGFMSLGLLHPKAAKSGEWV
jgi:hypothetical protein